MSFHSVFLQRSRPSALSRRLLIGLTAVGISLASCTRKPEASQAPEMADALMDSKVLAFAGHDGAVIDWSDALSSLKPVFSASLEDLLLRADQKPILAARSAP